MCELETRGKELATVARTPPKPRLVLARGKLIEISPASGAAEAGSQLGLIEENRTLKVRRETGGGPVESGKGRNSTPVTKREHFLAARKGVRLKG